jgi:hypothetical protein
MRLQAALVLPVGWKASPELLELTVSPRGDASGGFSVAIPENWDRGKSRLALAADIMADGQYLGQIAEGVADVQFGS